MYKESPLASKSLELGIESVMIAKQLRRLRTEFNLIHQFVKSSTSIGANIAEARDAESAQDMLHKLGIALKEARETEFWLKIIFATTEKSPEKLDEIRAILDEVIGMLIASRKTLSKRLSMQKSVKKPES